MKKFCTKCGRKLENNEKCTCEKIKKEEKIFDSKTNLFDKFALFLKKPVESLKDNHFLENNEYLVILLAALSYGILGLFLPFRSLIYSFIPITIISFLFFLLFPFLFSICKNRQGQKEEYKEYLNIVAISSIILLFGNIVALILSFISVILPTIIILASILLFLLFCYQGFCEKEDNINYIAYELFISFFLTIAILMFVISFL